MSPRRYQAGPRRQLATQATRSRIIDAARSLLADAAAPAFSVDAVAQRADVARMTVYYQFKSKAKLLEALFDDFAARANMQNLRKAFQEPDTLEAVNVLVEVFCNLWKTERAVLRRLTALAALDPEVDKALSERGSWRREALTQLLSRTRPGSQRSDCIDLLHVLTSFETYDALMSAGHSATQTEGLLRRAAAALLKEF